MFVDVLAGGGIPPFSRGCELAALQAKDSASLSLNGDVLERARDLGFRSFEPVRGRRVLFSAFLSNSSILSTLMEDVNAEVEAEAFQIIFKKKGSI